MRRASAPAPESLPATESSSSRPSWQKFVWPVVAVIVAGGAIVLSNRDPVGPGGRPIVRDAMAYQRENMAARDLTLATFEKASRGEPISNEERARLREAIPHLEAMNAFSPVKVGPYFALGQIYQIVGETTEAGVAYEQCISNVLVDNESKNTPEVQATVIEAKALLAETLLDYAILRAQAGAKPPELKDIRERALIWAGQAVAAQPNGARYQAAKASSLLALGREEEAKAAVIAAVAADPNHFKVKPLAALMGL